jgi:hypothetical protein
MTLFLSNRDFLLYFISILQIIKIVLGEVWYFFLKIESYVVNVLLINIS